MKSRFTRSRSRASSNTASRTRQQQQNHVWMVPVVVAGSNYYFHARVSSRLHGVQAVVEPVDRHKYFPQAMVTKPIFVFFGAYDERSPHNKSSTSSSSRSSTGRCASRDDTKNLASKTTEKGDASRGRLASDDPNRTLFLF